MFIYGVAKNKDKEKFYLVGSSIEEINLYCEDNVLEIVGLPDYVEPGMVAHHFKWVGKDKRPPVLEISRPYKY